jgi:transketolase
MSTEEIASEIRESTIKTLVNAGSGHSAGSLDLADLLSVLYFGHILHYDAKQPEDPERDRVILSAGHTCPAFYVTLAKAGYFDEELLDSLRQFGSPLQGHPHKDFSSTTNLPGIENTAGPLGQGTSFAVGVALGLKKKWEQNQIKRLPNIYCICGDGELQEGQCWEAFMTAAKYKLNNLTIIIDRNGIQIDGSTEQVMPLEPLKQKLESFGLCVFEVDGHNHQSLKQALHFDVAIQSKPVAILMHTIPGKGVDFMEGRPAWHGKTPNVGEAIEALHELHSLQNQLDQD